jgi:hypothetical protein
MRVVRGACLVVIWLAARPSAAAQVPDYRLELGAHLTSIDFVGLDERAPGVGFRGGWRFFEGLVAETDFNYLPENPGGNYGQTVIVSGLRAGLPIDRLELAVKAKPGAVRFGGTIFQAFNPGVAWKPALDLGGVVIYQTRSRVRVRADFGDLLIFYGPSIIATPLQVPGRRLGTTHNRQFSIGLEFAL